MCLAKAMAQRDFLAFMARAMADLACQAPASDRSVSMPGLKRGLPLCVRYMREPATAFLGAVFTSVCLAKAMAQRDFLAFMARAMADLACQAPASDRSVSMPGLQTGPAALRAIHAGNGLAGDFGGNVHITGNLVVDGDVSARAMPRAVVIAEQGDFTLSEFHDVTACHLTVPPGRYVVFARVLIRNGDDDPQNASATLVDRNNGFVMDRLDLRIPGKNDNSLMVFSLQGTLDVSGNINVVDLRCATFAGDAFNSSIFAVQVSEIKQAPKF